MANGDAALSPKALSVISGLLGASVGLVLSWFTVLTDLAVLQERVYALDERIKSQMDDRYRGSDARRDQELLVQRIAQNAKQIDELESLIRQHASDKSVHNK